MALDVQRTMFAARQSEMARRQAMESQRQANSQNQMVNTQSQLNNLLKEQRDFFEKEFNRLSKMASAKGQQDAVRGVRSTVKDPRQQEYYDLAQEGVEAGEIKAQQAVEAARKKAKFDTQQKIFEAQEIGVADKNFAQAGKYGAEARGQAFENLVAPNKFRAEQAVRFRKAGGPDSDELQQQILERMRARGPLATTHITNDLRTGSLPEQYGKIDATTENLRNRINALQKELSDPGQVAMRQDAGTMGKQREEMIQQEIRQLQSELAPLIHTRQNFVPAFGVISAKGDVAPGFTQQTPEQLADIAKRRGIIAEVVGSDDIQIQPQSVEQQPIAGPQFSPEQQRYIDAGLSQLDQGVPQGWSPQQRQPPPMQFTPQMRQHIESVPPQERKALIDAYVSKMQRQWAEYYLNQSR